MGLRVGIDLVRPDSVREAIHTHGERYLTRVYTDEERNDCKRDPERLAMRFAAKEAAMKALGRGDEPLAWREIEVVRISGGEPRLRLSGTAAELARGIGLGPLQLSLTRARGVAGAVVVGEVAR